MENIKIVDNCVSELLQDFVGKQISAPNLSWGFINDVTNRNNAQTNNYGFTNAPFENGQVQNTAYWFLYPLLLEVCGKEDIKVKELLRIRIGLYINKGRAQVNDAHIDREMPHMAALYYPDDFDGDTIFYTDKTATIELMRVKPKKGRMVIFNGLTYHASSEPTNSYHRITVNYNFII
jgi:hypothetical protein